ncbi:MAG: hypothetical protein KatS3mg101_1023 [Patescibacteria group bacterium]|nr:MAG: hypothetical protein KatS3mg101_1023 [Patescibacteria group bacterium]
MKKQKKQTTGWCLIPPYILAREDLTMSEKVVYGRILGLVNKKGYCYATNKWLGKQVGLASGTIANIVSKLKDKKLVYVEVIRDQNNKVTERRIFVPSFIPEWGGIHSGVNRGIHSEVKESNRDIEGRKEYIYYQQQAADEDKNSFNNVKGFSTLRESLSSIDLSKKTSHGGAHYEWQDHAIRAAKFLGFKPTKSWFKLFREAYKKGQKGLILSTFATVADAANANDPERYFYKVFNSKS